ncbi:MAG TPA: hypothetical protein VGN69_07660 [Solirubrobacteraceae bacterium]|nr:hypothetical protein [Solirubrobacteraceae bacterium]
MWRTKTRLLACERPSGPLRRIHSTGGALGRFTAAGTYVAYTEDNDIVSSQTSGDQLSLTVFDVHRGRSTFTDVVAGSSTCCTSLEDPRGGSMRTTTTSLDAFVLNRHGFLAWLTTTAGRQTLAAHDTRGTHDLARATSGIAHLKLRGNRVSWTRHGHARTATLR